MGGNDRAGHIIIIIIIQVPCRTDINRHLAIITLGLYLFTARY